MAYEGQIAAISLGKAGLWTDSPQTNIPAGFLTLANNLQFSDDKLEKEAGSRRWNSTAFSAGVKIFSDFWINSTTQRVISLLKDGTLIKMPNYYTQIPITPTGSAPAILSALNNVSMVRGGNEVAGNNRKLFIYNGFDPVQVISGDGVTRTNIAAPASDWTGTNQPFGAVIHRNSVFAFGNSNDAHRVYKSAATNHEDFTTTPVSYSVYPGESEKLICLYVFRTRLYAFKYPRGVYQLDDSDSNPANWFFTKLTDDIGGASPQSATTVLDDMILANNYGSLTSLKAALTFGDVYSADIFHQNRVYNFAENEIRQDVFNDRFALFYPSKKTLFVSFQSSSNFKNDRICRLDFKGYPQQQPKISWTTKDQPNCLGLIKDNLLVERPFYGADDGYLYQMDIADRWVGDTADNQAAYTAEAYLPAMDFSEGNALIAQQNKLFDFLEVEFEACGDWDLLSDVYIDGKFHRTLRFNMSGRSDLDSFNLNLDPIDGAVPFSIRLPLNGMGRRISLRLYNEEAGQNIKLTTLRIYYRLSGQQAAAK